MSDKFEDATKEWVYVPIFWLGRIVRWVPQ